MIYSPYTIKIYRHLAYFETPAIIRTEAIAHIEFVYRFGATVYIQYIYIYKLYLKNHLYIYVQYMKL